jgi:hypothetical protein
VSSQNVPGIVVLHCNGRTCGNAYLTALSLTHSRARARTHARTHAHALVPSILPMLEVPAKGFFWNLLELGRRIRVDVHHG